MPVLSSAATSLQHTVEATGTIAQMGHEPAQSWGDASLRMTSIFPPRDADPDTRAAWLARSPWPEVVFATAH